LLEAMATMGEPVREFAAINAGAPPGYVGVGVCTT
jgi:hypothetical protein